MVNQIRETLLYLTENQNNISIIIFSPETYWCDILDNLVISTSSNSVKHTQKHERFGPSGERAPSIVRHLGFSQSLGSLPAVILAFVVLDSPNYSVKLSISYHININKFQQIYFDGDPMVTYIGKHWDFRAYHSIGFYRNPFCYLISVRFSVGYHEACISRLGKVLCAEKPFRVGAM